MTAALRAHAGACAVSRSASEVALGRVQPREVSRAPVRTDRARDHHVPGIRVGHATDAAALTGVSVVLCDRPAVAGVELRGWADRCAGLEYLDPRHLVGTVNGVVLGGGSRFGGEAIWGVLRWLEEHGQGYAAGPTVVPHVAGRDPLRSRRGRRPGPSDARDGIGGGRRHATAA